MIEKLTARPAEFIARKAKLSLDSETYKEMKFGLDAGLLFIVKTAALIYWAWLTNHCIYVLVYIGLIFIMRALAGGVHMDNSLLCTIISFGYFIGGIYLARMLPYNPIYTTMIFAVCFALNAIYAPGQTENRPIGPKWRRRFKTGTLAAVVIYYILSLNPGAYQNLFTVVTVVSTLTILPVTYKFLGERRPN